MAPALSVYLRGRALRLALVEGVEGTAGGATLVIGCLAHGVIGPQEVGPISEGMTLDPDGSNRDWTTGGGIAALDGPVAYQARRMAL